MSGDELDLPEVDLASLLSIVGGAVDALVVRALADAGLRGLRPGHGYLVQRLLVGPATATELAAALGVSQQAVSKTLRELVDLGYAEFATDRADRRRRPAALTDRGRDAVRVAREARAAFERGLREDVGAERLDAATEVLTAALQRLHLADAVHRRAVPPPTS